jgi:CHAD domain-containing protein
MAGMPRQASSPTTVAAFAAASLKDRLSQVHRRLQRAAAQGMDEHEPIHQFRVATRRARSALELLAPLLHEKRSRWFERKLKKLRHAAGAARDLDLCRLRFSHHKTDLPAGVTSALLERRRRAQRKLERLAERWDDKRWKKKQADLIDTSEIAGTGAQPLPDFAPTALQPILSEFVKAVQSPDRSARQLHALRVAGKQLRYALELLSPALPKRACTNLQQQLERLQDQLGEMNDYATIAEVLDLLIADVSRGKARRWLKEERQRVRESFSERRAKFLRGWTAKERQRWEKLCERCASS